MNQDTSQPSSSYQPPKSPASKYAKKEVRIIKKIRIRNQGQIDINSIKLHADTSGSVENGQLLAKGEDFRHQFKARRKK